MISFSVFLLVFGVIAGCNSLSSDTPAVTGNVTYHQKIALPDDAVVTITLEDVSRADAPAEVRGRQVIDTKGAQVPISFRVTYEPNKIAENHSYSLRAKIEDGSGKLLFASDTNIPVITRDNPTDDVEIIVVPVSS